MSGNQRKTSANDMAEQRLKDRVRSFITDGLKNPEDVVVRVCIMTKVVVAVLIVTGGAILSLEVQVSRLLEEE